MSRFIPRNQAKSCKVDDFLAPIFNFLAEQWNGQPSRDQVGVLAGLGLEYGKKAFCRPWCGVSGMLVVLPRSRCVLVTSVERLAGRMPSWEPTTGHMTAGNGVTR